MDRALYKIIKTYPRRGHMQQFRIESATAFHCFRCSCGKTSKLLTVYLDDWNKLLCNGCYGRLLSIYNIKAGTDSEDVKANSLGELLLSLISEDQARQYAEKIYIAGNRIKFLSKQCIRFLGTAEYVSQGLMDDPNLDWSPAVIGLCKAFEVELIERLINPLKRIAFDVDLSVDCKDKDLSRIAKYCAGQNEFPPEIGVIGYFLQTASHSKNRINESALLISLKKLLSKWPKANWLFEDEGALGAISQLTSRYRNKAAHIEDLSRNDYSNCLEFVVGKEGILWYLVAATEEKSLIMS